MGAKATSCDMQLTLGWVSFHASAKYLQAFLVSKEYHVRTAFDIRKV